jgi:hypothetical protein
MVPGDEAGRIAGVRAVAGGDSREHRRQVHQRRVEMITMEPKHDPVDEVCGVLLIIAIVCLVWGGCGALIQLAI